MLTEAITFALALLGTTAAVAIPFALVAVLHQRSIRKAAQRRSGTSNECKHQATEFTPSTGQTRCRTCGELIWQDIPRS